MPRKKTAPAPQSDQKLRIIGGQWRSRVLSFPAVEGLRPTGNRIRETLFNWLMPHIEGVRVLDLFAGSGALGFEALSRGALWVDFCELNPQAAKALNSNLKLLSANSDEVLGAVHQQAAQSLLSSLASNADQAPYHLVFLDPPFAQNLWQACFEALAQSSLLAEDALIYIESPKQSPLLLPPHWQVAKEKTSGAVCYQLIQTETKA